MVLSRRGSVRFFKVYILNIIFVSYVCTLYLIIIIEGTCSPGTSHFNEPSTAVTASLAPSSSHSVLGLVNVCVSESDPDSLRALPLSLPQVIPLAATQRQILNTASSTRSITSSVSSSAIRSRVDGYPTEGNQDGYYEWTPQVFLKLI